MQITILPLKSPEKGIIILGLGPDFAPESGTSTDTRELDNEVALRRLATGKLMH